LFAGTLVKLLVIHGRPTFSILPRTQTEGTSTFITCCKEHRNNMFRKPLQGNLHFGYSSKKIDLKPQITPFAFGFLTNDGRHILTLKNKSTSAEWGMVVRCLFRLPDFFCEITSCFYFTTTVSGVGCHYNALNETAQQHAIEA